jgi:hypothetical protein
MRHGPDSLHETGPSTEARRCRWTTVGLSQSGTAHVRSGVPCQDAHGWRVLGAGLLVAAVGDGAGSASQSAIGSALAVEAALDAVEKSLESRPVSADLDDAAWMKMLDGAVEAAISEIERRATTLGADPRDFATTLLIAVVIPELAAVLQIGDGAIVARSSDGVWAFTLPPRSEHINETMFITNEGALSGAQRAVWRQTYLDIALLTDGLQRLAIDFAAGRPHEGFFRPLFEFSAKRGAEPTAQDEIGSFLSSERVTSKTDDDLTLILATRRQEGP